jgi:hypothetical protein
MRLSLKVTDKLISQRKFEGSSILRLWHGYCLLLLARFIVKINSMKQSRNTCKIRSFVRKACVKLGLSKAWFLKELAPRKEAKIFAREQ